MSIATELTLLANSKQAIKNSINQKGGSITDSTPFADYSTAIDNLPSGGGDSSLINLIERNEEDYYTVSIPSGITRIGKYAFYNCVGLLEPVIPNGVTIIGNYAFQGCRNIDAISLPSTVTTIGSYAFSDCSSLASVTIPEGIENIDIYTFSNCNSLSSVTIPGSVKRISQSAFSGCTSLSSIGIPIGVTYIGQQAFYNCTSLTSITVEAATPHTLGAYAFDNTNNCPIYVPSESVDAYKAASGWSSYASRIYPITQVATVDGNPVYNYEIGNKNATTVLDVELEKMPAGTSVEFSEGLTNITAGKINYQQVTLPSTFTGFGDSDMIGSSVTTITSNAVTPPGAFRNRLGGSGLTAIYVPASAVDAYKEDATWSSFASIIQAIPAE